MLHTLSISVYHFIIPVLLSLNYHDFHCFWYSLLEGRVLHKAAWVAKLLGTHISVQVHKKVKFSWRDNSSLAVQGSSENIWKYVFMFFLLTNTANLEELQSVESRQAANLETQLEELKERCQEKQDNVEDIRYLFEQSLLLVNSWAIWSKSFKNNHVHSTTKNKNKKTKKKNEIEISHKINYH